MTGRTSLGWFRGATTTSVTTSGSQSTSSSLRRPRGLTRKITFSDCSWMSEGRSSGRRLPTRSTDGWAIARDRASNAEKGGSTSFHQTSRGSPGPLRKTFSSFRGRSRSGTNGRRSPRRSLAARRIRLKTGSTPCSRRSARRKPSGRT